MALQKRAEQKISGLPACFRAPHCPQHPGKQQLRQRLLWSRKHNIKENSRSLHLQTFQQNYTTRSQDSNISNTPMGDHGSAPFMSSLNVAFATQSVERLCKRKTLTAVTGKQLIVEAIKEGLGPLGWVALRSLLLRIMPLPNSSTFYRFWIWRSSRLYYMKDDSELIR